MLVLAARLVPAAEPCPDEPGLDGIACRVDALGARADAANLRLTAARTACDAGHTADAIRELRGMGRPLAGAGDDPDVAITDALRRAPIDRLRRHPCPELVDVLSPRRGERIPHGDLFVLLRLAAGADPATLSVQLDDDPPVALDPGAVSDTQAWARLRCDGPLRQLQVTIRSRDGARSDLETVPISCGGARVLGAEIDSLVLADYVPERLRVVPVRPLRGGTTVALVATRALRSKTRPARRRTIVHAGTRYGKMTYGDTSSAKSQGNTKDHRRGAARATSAGPTGQRSKHHRHRKEGIGASGRI